MNLFVYIYQKYLQREELFIVFFLAYLHSKDAVKFYHQILLTCKILTEQVLLPGKVSPSLERIPLAFALFF